MSHFTELADLFDKLADEYERAPAPAAKVAAPVAPAAAEPTRASKLAELIQSATGEELPPAVAERIASDDALLEHVTKLAEYGARPTPLGDAVTKTGSAPPAGRREKVAAAWERWNDSVRGG